MVTYIKMEDPDLPAFYFDPLIHPIPPHQSQGPKLESWEMEDDEENDFFLPEGVDPFLSVQPLYTENTAAGIALLWAPRPFDLRYHLFAFQIWYSPPCYANSGHVILSNDYYMGLRRDSLLNAVLLVRFAMYYATMRDEMMHGRLPAQSRCLAWLR